MFKLITVSSFLITALFVHCGFAVETLAKHGDPQVIILKLDDIVAYRSREAVPISPRWQRVTEFIQDKDIKASFGIIGYSLEEDNEAYFRWIKALHAGGRIEFWNHGYKNRRGTDKTGEFEGAFEEQKDSLEKTQRLAKEKLGITLKVFGPHWSGTNESTARALRGIPEIAMSFCGPQDSGKFIFPRVLTLENPTHVPDFQKFKTAYERVGHDKECLALQGHPNSWDDKRWANFVKIIDYLIAKDCVFMTPSEYKASLSAERAGNDAEWTSIFNGRNLDGWEVKCRPQDRDKIGYWKVVDGSITAETPAGSKHHYIWLLSKQEYGNFELKMKVQTYASTTGNSGIQVRSRYDDDTGWLDGPQVDINPPGPWRNGFIYDETREVKAWLWPDVGGPANAKPTHAPEGWSWSHADDEEVWNDVHVICEGPHVTTIINGITVADCDGSGRLDDAAHRSHGVGMKGHIGLQIHPGNELLIRFKELKVFALK